ncbi:PAS domain S-box protein [Pararhodobacter zhoushanensis]|uniref:PAS domain S-box protein n=1 Tax=Pararhodobacter zhoushanensis TaxID=2479545 RepID=UPI000F8EDC7E|nr:PAS domain S-box protein [Pararhodobacter zhoushanensis]
MDDGSRQSSPSHRSADTAQELVIDALGQLLRSSPGDLDATITQILQRLCVMARADCGVLYQPQGTGWCASHGPLQDGAVVPLECLVRDPDAFAAGEAMALQDVGSLPTGPLRTALEARGIRSSVVIPMLQDATLSGLIALDYIHQPSCGSTRDLWLIQSLADGILAALGRRRTECELQASRSEQASTLERLRATLAATPELVLEMDADGTCIDFHCGSPELLEISPSSTLGQALEDSVPAAVAKLQRDGMARARVEGTAAVPRYSIDHADKTRWYDTIISHRTKGSGQYGYVFRIRDVTEDHQREAENAMLIEISRSMTNLVMVLDEDLNVIWANPAMEKRSGWALEELRGGSVSTFLDPLADEATMDRIRDAMRARVTYTTDLLRHDRKGAPYWVDVTVQPMQDRAGMPQGFLIIENDITALKRHEADLERTIAQGRQSHDRLHAAIESLQDGFSYYDADDRLVLCNERYRQSTPRTAAMLKPGVRFEDVIRAGLYHGEFPDAVGNEDAWLAERMEKHRLPYNRMELLLKDGRYVRVFERQTPEGGRVSLRVDVTAMKEAEQRMNDIIVGAGVGTWDLDLLRSETTINEHWRSMLGWSGPFDHVLTRENWVAPFHPDDNDMMREHLRAVINGTRDAVELEVRLRHANGHWVHVLVRGRISARDHEGNPLRISGLGFDMTGRRHAEERLRAILESSSVATWQLDCETGRVVIDEQYAAMIGYHLDELVPWTRDKFDALVHPDDLPQLRSGVSSIYGADTANVGHEFRIRHRDGRWVWVMSHIRVQRWTSPGVPAEETGIHIDITERKMREAALADAKLRLEEALEARRESEQRYSDIAEASDEWFWEVAPGRKITHLTAGFERTTGIPVDRILNRGLEELGVTPDSDSALGDWERLARNVMAREKLTDFLFRLRPGRNADPIWLRISGAPFFNAAGQYAGYRGVGTNVSALIAATEKAEAASHAKSRFLANMSHELRTPLTGVLGMAELLGETEVAPYQRDMINTIRDSGEGLLAILNDILDLAKIEAGKMMIEHQPFSPTELLGRVRALFLPRAEAGGLALRIHVDPDCQAPRMGDANRLLQVLNNLVGNALKFTESGSIDVSVRPDPVAKDSLRFEVRDTGIGMSPEQTAKVFEEFEQAETSTARRYGGTGLGLSITRKLAVLMGGSITLDSVAGQGTHLVMTVPAPRLSDDDKAGAVLHVGGVAMGGGASQQPGIDFTGMRMLVADDNHTNRRILESMLGAMGISVTLAEDGQDACDKFLPGAFDVILLDISMPGLDGTGALAAIRMREAEAGIVPVPALAVTANAMQHQIDEYLAAGFTGHVAKPFRRETLTRALTLAVAG